MSAELRPPTVVGTKIWTLDVRTGRDDGRLSEQQAVAILTHEVAHHLGRATRYRLVIGWLSAPWRGVAAIFGCLLRSIVRHVPTAWAALVLVPLVGVVAAVQTVQHHAWLSLSVLVGLALVAWVQPVADAAVCRASERAADAYTADLGNGLDLAKALANFPPAMHRTVGGPTTRRWQVDSSSW